MTNRSILAAVIALTALFAMPTASQAGGAHLHKMLEAKRACILSLFTHRHAAPAKAAPKMAAAKPMKAAAKPMK